MAGTQLNNITILDLTTGLTRTLETGPTPDILNLGVDVELVSGANMVIDGNLTVNGTTTTVHSDQVNITDNHLYLNADYTTTVAQTGGFVVNVLPTATSDTVAAGGFTAGVASTSNPTVTTTGSATFSAGDIIQISGANNPDNDGIFEVESHVGTTLTIRGVGTVATTQDWFTTQFTTDTTVGGTITVVNVNVLRGTSSGTWETFTGSSTTGLTYNTLTTQGTVDLQSAYVAGNTITTSAVEGNVTLAGTETVAVTATGGLSVATQFNATPTVFDVQMSGANGFSIDGTAASNVTVTNDALTLSSVGGSVSVQGESGVTIDSSAGPISIGTGTGGDPINIGTGSSDHTISIGDTGASNTSIALSAGSTGSITLASGVPETQALAALTTSGLGGDSVNMFVGGSDPSVSSVAAPVGSIFFRDAGNAGTTGELWLKTGAAGSAWSVLSTGTPTLQQAYAAGNTIVTNATDGALDVSGTEAISLDASAASNFTVDGANLTLSTTTSGNVVASAAGSMLLDALNGPISIGVAAAAQPINIGTGAAARTITVGNATGATSINFDSGTGGYTFDSTVDGSTAFAVVSTTGTNGDSVEWFVSDTDPSAGAGIAAPVGSTLWRDAGGAGTTGELWVKIGAADTAWEQVATGNTTETLQQAYAAGNTIVTNASDGPLDVSGTEAISLDASSASNFSVAGANLTLETTTSGTVDINSAADITMTFATANTAAMVVDDGTNSYLTFDSTVAEPAVEVGQFLDIVGNGAGVTLTAGGAISAGDVITIESTSGDAILADANTGTTLDGLAIGVAAYAATATNPVKVYTVAGSLIPINFASAPAAADNGRPVFVSGTPGEGTLTAPTGSGSVVFLLGVLQGADGSTTSPLVLFQPQFIAVRP